MTNTLAQKITGSLHIIRQVLATIAASLQSIAVGLTFGVTGVLLPQLEADSNYPYDKSLDSWVASVSPLAMTLGSLLSGPLSDGVGRRLGQFIVLVPFTLGWIIMGLANTNAVMIIGRFLTGLCTGAVRACSIIYCAELTDPKYRAVVLFSQSAAIHVGVLISHTVGKYCHWKTSCFIFTVPNILAFTILLFLKESPLWLLSKGKIDQGIESFKQFRGNENEKELATVLEKVKKRAEENITFKDILNIIFSKPFMKSVTIIFLLFLAVQWCGINTLSFYAEVIFKKTFGSDIDSYMMVLVCDCTRIISSVVISIFGEVLPSKITFVICSLITTLMLIALVIYLYLNPVGLVWIAVTCMVIYIAMGSIMMCISWSVSAEIFPSKVRGFGSGLSSSISFILLFSSVKVTPEIMQKFGEQVMYAIFAVVSLVTGISLCFVLPETSGRSLQDIEDAMYRKPG